MGVVYLAYCGSWQLSLHVPCFYAFYIFNTTPNPTSPSFFQNVFVLVLNFSTIIISICHLMQEVRLGCSNHDMKRISCIEWRIEIKLYCKLVGFVNVVSKSSSYITNMF